MLKTGFTHFFSQPTRQFVLWLIVLLVVPPFIATCTSSDEIKSTQDNAPNQNVDLTVAMALPSTNTLVFSVKNIGQKPVRADEPAAGLFKFVFVKPDGKNTEFNSTICPPGIYTVPVPLLQPGETKRWDIDISQYFGRRMTEKGVYRLTWVYTQWISQDQKIEVKSNELLILKNEDSPRINPETGQPE